ncbi:STAS/SEC14 domain-containing protein [Nocardiopsis sp. HNM0947]|uniref:STAS/SEC14 domain-containing protein n=1 Tax=Nocardiopsis coralli TaxID=2772213 RepID=A0ABR9P5P5_9ACTN|nr:STAS/SEC14 domain-containing protein [Nocardiopsis coralli]MBE2999175.1 STAS/SEC14 domain-containing protein [Nocardiopsis coralli]
MYRKLGSSHDNVLAYQVEGKISQAEMDGMLGEVREEVDGHGRVRLLLRLRGWPHAELSTLRERFQFLREYGDGVDRIAVVCDERILGFLADAADRVSGTDLRSFRGGDEDAAWAWIEAGAEEQDGAR